MTPTYRITIKSASSDASFTSIELGDDAIQELQVCVRDQTDFWIQTDPEDTLVWVSPQSIEYIRITKVPSPNPEGDLGWAMQK